jgi:hypothetical protein
MHNPSPFALVLCPMVMMMMINVLLPIKCTILKRVWTNCSMVVCTYYDSLWYSPHSIYLGGRFISSFSCSCPSTLVSSSSSTMVTSNIRVWNKYFLSNVLFSKIKKIPKKILRDSNIYILFYFIFLHKKKIFVKIYYLCIYLFIGNFSFF